MSDSLILASWGIDVSDLEKFDFVDENETEISIIVRLRDGNIGCQNVEWFLILG